MRLTRVVTVTHQSQSATWLVRKGKHRVLLNDLQLYVFCRKYREQNMRQNKAGAFEIFFCGEEAAQSFREVFFPPNSVASSEANVTVKIIEVKEEKKEEKKEAEAKAEAEGEAGPSS